MAGMFYSLEEAAEKLNKTKEELKQIVKEGKLREFRDGPNLLFKVEEVEALMSDMGEFEPEVIPEAEPETPPTKIPELEAPELEMPVPEAPEPEMPDLEATDMEAPAPSPEEEDMDLDEILLAPETGTPVLSDDLTDADTALTGQGTNVLGQTDRDYEITDDTMADTVIPPGTSSEVPLEEIEEDVNLDSFGSGSGLLDLSLQADDTSLGGILDEIYTAEGEGPEAGEVEPVAEADSAAPITADADQMIPDEGLAAPLPTQEVPTLAAPLIEMVPDKQSNILGMMLFLPLIAVIYTTVVAVAGFKEIMPSILGSIQDFIWYIVAVAIVTTGLITGISFMVGGERTKKAKPPKAKKEKVKKEKPKKEKKPKKSKK
jgi:excisionase family DNA binding protein